jgi:hypothetical protein
LKEKDDKREIPKDGRSAVAALAVGFVFLNHQLKAKKRDPKHHPETKRHQHHAKKFDASQKAVIASRLMPFYKQAAKERQVRKSADSVVEKIPPQKTKARDEAGKAAGVNGRYVDMDWMDANQLGRRNLTPDQFTLLLGRRYNRTKKAAHGRADRDFSEDQIDTPKTNTAATLGEEYGVSEATVKRAGQYAAT